MLRVTLDTRTLRVRRLVDAAGDAGFAATVTSHEGAGAPLGGSGATDTEMMRRHLAAERALWLRLLWLSLIFTVPVFIISMVLQWANPRITLRWRRASADQGAPMQEVTLHDTAYLARINHYDEGDPLRYEKLMLETWFRGAFVPAK